ncbi:MAG: wax ester/triacylglycerol synthase family O-acyltransferase [Acidimicrobiales bacterium]
MGPDEHMSDFEALMWNLEKDPRLSSNIANMSILDRAPDMERLRETMERASIVFPRLRQRVAPVFGRLAPPKWEIDPNFDLDHHLKHISLGGRGSRAELYRLATSLFMDPFDRTRPLWEFVVIEGLRGGKAAMVQRLHHTITDGQGGLRLSLEFIDFTRDAPQREPVAADPVEHADGSVLGSVTDAVTHVARRQFGVARRTVDATIDAVVHPATIVENGNAAFEMARSTLRQAQVGDAPMSPLWTERSLSRSFATLDVPLASAIAAAKRHEVSVNDVFVAGATIAAADYHRQMGAPAHGLRMAMPISRRADRAIGGNLFSPSQSIVPTDERPPFEVLADIHRILDRTKAEPAVGAANALAGFINLLPTSMVTRTGYRFAGTIDFVTSNLRAAPMDTFIAGALMESNYPMGPLAGAAFNITTMSFRGNLNMGVVIDTAAIAEPDRLVSCLKSAYKRLVAAPNRS